MAKPKALLQNTLQIKQADETSYKQLPLEKRDYLFQADRYDKSSTIFYTTTMRILSKKRHAHITHTLNSQF